MSVYVWTAIYSKKQFFPNTPITNVLLEVFSKQLYGKNDVFTIPGESYGVIKLSSEDGFRRIDDKTI